jgi:hypothetical protein
MKSLRSFSLFAMMAFSVIGCKKDDTAATAKKLYVLTIEDNNTTGNAFIRYVADGVSKTITDGVTETAFAEDMEVEGQDVYVLANREIIATGVDNMVVYKNGTPIYTLPYSDSFRPNCLAIQGGNVYLAGTGNDGLNGNRLKLWKNGVFSNVTDGANDVRVFDMQVSGNDIYLAGKEYNNASSYWQAKYWKNGTGMVLSAGTGVETQGELHRILVKGTDVYGAGMINSKPVLWKNATATPLSTDYGTCYGLAVSGTDVYTAGAVQAGNTYQAVYWKNGTQVTLSNSTSAPDGASVFGIGTDGTDVYVVGTIELGSNVSKGVYWKNGVKNIIPVTGLNNSDGYRMVFK